MPFFTNMDGQVFGLRLPQEVAGALFSRYSRSTKGLRRTFLDEFLGNAELDLNGLLPGRPVAGDQSVGLRKARAFYERVLVGFGDDSVAQLGGAHIACEGISNVAAKSMEDARIGIAPLEKSTRYVRFDQRDENGDYPYYREPKIMASQHRDAYLELMNLLFTSYSRQLEPMILFIRESLPIEEVELKHPQTGETVSYGEARKDARLAQWAKTAYGTTVRAHACDLLRGYLPAATLTNVGLFGVGQAFEYLLSKFYSHELPEVRELGASIHKELNQLIPSFVKRAKFSRYIADTFTATRGLAESLDCAPAPDFDEPVTLVDFDHDAEEKVVAAILYPHSWYSLRDLRRIAKSFGPEERKRILDEYLKRRQSRRDKPGRAFEQVYYTFDILGNLGLYRDLHRHRMLSQERQDFTTAHGYDCPKEIEEAGFKPEFDSCMERAASLYGKIRRGLPLESQYVVPFAFKVRWYMKMNLREAIHIGELRTSPQGHPDYRTVVQEMWRKIQGVHPILAEYARFLDWGTYKLGRLQSEMKTEYKRALHQG